MVERNSTSEFPPPEKSPQRLNLENRLMKEKVGSVRIQAFALYGALTKAENEVDLQSRRHLDEGRIHPNRDLIKAQSIRDMLNEQVEAQAYKEDPLEFQTAYDEAHLFFLQDYFAVGMREWGLGVNIDDFYERRYKPTENAANSFLRDLREINIEKSKQRGAYAETALLDDLRDIYNEEEGNRPR